VIVANSARPAPPVPEPVTFVLVGAGLRGCTYARHAVDSGAGRVVAVAEPDPARRAAFAQRYDLPPERVFDSWAALVAAGRLARAAIVATPDVLHEDPAVALAGLGYHLLLEKPMAPTEAAATRIAEAVERAGVLAAVCHVLRYTPYTRAVREVVASGRLGQLVSVRHLEPVGWWHQAHSFVRGNWRRLDGSGPMLLTKSCHDLDWLAYVIGAAPARVTSFGGLPHFHAGNRPALATDRCLDCPIEAKCPYSAVRLYLGCVGDPEREAWPLAAVTADATEAGVRAALRSGPYGRCVYDCDNDVVDHQVVAMQYPDGLTATFTMTAFTQMGRRQTQLFGSHGSLDGDGRVLRITDFHTGDTEVIDTGDATGHDGGDAGLIGAFLAGVAAGDPALLVSDLPSSLASHRAVWAAERARLSGEIVHLAEASPH
jgi:predicted dehydrogenase